MNFSVRCDFNFQQPKVIAFFIFHHWTTVLFVNSYELNWNRNAIEEIHLSIITYVLLLSSTTSFMPAVLKIIIYDSNGNEQESIFAELNPENQFNVSTLLCMFQVKNVRYNEPESATIETDEFGWSIRRFRSNGDVIGVVLGDRIYSAARLNSFHFYKSFL